MLRLGRHLLTLGALAAALAGCQQRAVQLNAFENLNENSEFKKSWSSLEAKKQLAGYTLLRNLPGKSNEAIYFDAEGVAYRWISGQAPIASATWTVETRSMIPGAPKQTFVCTVFNNRRSDGQIIPNSTTNRCSDPSLLFIPATEHARGDVFGLAQRGTAPMDLTIERIHIADLKAQVAAADQKL